MSILVLKRTVVFGLLTLINSCRTNNYSTQSDWGGGAITSFGQFVNPKAGYSISVYEENGLLRYNLVVSKDTVVESNENAGIYQKWLLYMDKKKNLWVKSTDIGDWVWNADESGAYKKYFIPDRPQACNPIPAGFR